MSSESLLSEHGDGDGDDEEEEEEEELFPELRRAMEARAEHMKTRNYRVLHSLATVLGGLSVALILSWCLSYKGGFAWNSAPALQFNWHPFLMVLGLVFLYAQSMLIYRTGRSTTKKKLKIVHTVLHLSAFIIAVVGLKAVFDAHNYANPPKPNLYTLHSWIGLTTVIIFATQFLFGFVTFLFPGLPRSWRQIVMPIHTAVGTGTFVLAVATSMMGLTEKVFQVENYAQLPSEGMLLNFIGVMLVFFGVLVLYLVNESDYKRTPLATDEMVLTETE